MEMKEIRERIKRLDYEVVKILNQRMELALRTMRLKENGLAEKEEQEFFENIEQMHEGIIGRQFGRKLFEDIMTESRRVQNRGSKLIGFQGEHGANSEVAARTYSKELAAIPNKKFVEVFDGVNRGWFDYGIVPVQNSLEGGVTEVNDLLIDNDLFICGEIRLRINHAFLTLKETDYRGIREVYSHPQALAQCRGFIERNNLEDRPYYNTAGAARMLSELRPKATAVIAHKLCAKIYDLDIIKENIEDDSSNITRFVVLTKQDCDLNGNKISIVFSTPHQCGSLNEVLSIFAEADINLTRIESRPSRKGPGNFAFLVDFNGSIKDPRIADALEAVKKKTVMYKYLGCYPEAQLTDGS